MTAILKISTRLFLAAFALVAAYAPAPAVAAAGTNFDGSWSVLIMTSSGPCDRSYRFGLSIRNGDILYNGSASVNVNGRVSGNGSLRVRVSAGAQAGSLQRGRCQARHSQRFAGNALSPVNAARGFDIPQRRRSSSALLRHTAPPQDAA